jgi:hypothetical protein
MSPSVRPFVARLANYIVPLQIGAPDVALPPEPRRGGRGRHRTGAPARQRSPQPPSRIPTEEDDMDDHGARSLDVDEVQPLRANAQELTRTDPGTR